MVIIYINITFIEVAAFVFVFLGTVAEDEEYIRIALPWFVIYTILSIVGMFFAIVCLVFNLWFRNQK